MIWHIQFVGKNDKGIPEGIILKHRPADLSKPVPLGWTSMSNYEFKDYLKSQDYLADLEKYNEILIDEQKVKVRQAIELGKELIVEYSARNALKNLSELEVSYAAARVAPIQNLLSVGALRTALSLIQQVEPDERIFKQSDLDMFFDRITEFLGDTQD